MKIQEPLMVMHSKQARSRQSDPGQQAVNYLVQKLKTA